MAMNFSDLFLSSAGGVKPWVSGGVVERYAYVVSPTDLQIYQRKTVTGSGATDPFLDKTNYRPVTIDRVGSISNAWSTGAATVDTNGSSYFTSQTISTIPALSIGVRTLVLSLTGRGAVKFAAWVVGTTSTGTLRYEIEVDGTKVFDATYAANAGASRYAIGIGGVNFNGAGTGMAAFDNIDFSSTFQIFATSSTASPPFVFRNAYLGYQS